MQNVVELRSQLCDVFTKLKSNKVKPAIAKEMSSTASKIIGSVRLQLEYANARKEVPSIDFLKGEPRRAK